jgi:hypothetical protein
MMRPGAGLRAWVGLYLQERREKRAAAVGMPAAPVWGVNSWEFGASAPGWYDAILRFTFNQASVPAATLEVWFSREGGPFILLTAVQSTASTYRHAVVAQPPATVSYKLRYAFGNLFGPFSDTMDMDL